MKLKFTKFAGVFVAAMMASTPVMAAQCGNTGAGFNKWLGQFKKEAAAAGIRKSVLNSALKGVSYSNRVIRFDRNQKSFKLSFDQFYKKRVNNAMINKGRRLLKQNAALFNRVEKRYGVPGSVIVAIWGLETNYGGYLGSLPIIRSLATLAYDCRRSAFFTNELMAALRIVQRGDMSPSAMKGAWAGEIGQTQFLASSYLKWAVDGDGNGRRDLIRSKADVIASTANYLKAHGWKRGAGWGPGQPNYRVLKLWNKATVYVKTISVMASKIEG